MQGFWKFHVPGDKVLLCLGKLRQGHDLGLVDIRGNDAPIDSN
jgi:hypothetical protein